MPPDISQRDSMSDRELLIRIDERTENLEERLNNHGKRIVSLERWRWGIAGALGLIAFVIMNLENIRDILN